MLRFQNWNVIKFYQIDWLVHDISRRARKPNKRLSANCLLKDIGGSSFRYPNPTTTLHVCTTSAATPSGKSSYQELPEFYLIAVLTGRL